MARTVIRLPPPVAEQVVIDTARSVGRLRDLDVALDHLDQLCLTAKGPDGVAVARLARRLARRRHRLHDRARAALARGRLRRLLTAVRRLRRGVETLPLGAEPLAAIAASLLAPAWRAVIDHPGWHLSAEASLQVGSDDERVLHDLRVRIKHVRDAIELVAFNPIESTGDLARLGELAEVLGQLRDWGRLQCRVERVAPGLAAVVGARVMRSVNRWHQLRAAWVADQAATPLSAPNPG